MSAPRHYHQTVRSCGDCPLLGPSIGRRTFCGARGSRVILRGIPHRRIIPNLDQIPDWCPLPVETTPPCPRCGGAGIHIGETPLPDGNGAYTQYRCSVCENGYMTRPQEDHRWENLAAGLTGGGRP